MKCVVANRHFTFLSLMGMETGVCGYGWGQGWLLHGRDGDGDDVETIEGIKVGMGMRAVGIVGDWYKYLSPCSSLICISTALSMGHREFPIRVHLCFSQNSQNANGHNFTQGLT